MENLRKIGYTQKPHGLAGELKVSIEEMYEEDFLQCETVFLNIKGKLLPFFVETIRGGNFLIVKFEDVNNKEKATEIQGKELSVRERDLIPDDSRVKPIIESYTYLAGYLMMDKTAGQVAVIQEVIEMPQQEMAVVTYKNRELLIPLHPTLVAAIDKNKKEILMDLPDGLLDL